MLPICEGQHWFMVIIYKPGLVKDRMNEHIK